MSNLAHLKMLEQGAAAWNAWRGTSSEPADLVDAHLEARSSAVQFLRSRYDRGMFRGCEPVARDLQQSDRQGRDFAGSRLWGTMFRTALLEVANFCKADLFMARFEAARLARSSWSLAHVREVVFAESRLSRASFDSAQIEDSDFTNCSLRQSSFKRARVSATTFRGADLTDADLQESVLLGTDFRDARLVGCRVYGTAGWSVNTAGATQSGLLITPAGEAKITVDEIEMAQFIHMLLDNRKFRKLMDAVSSKLVLVLGRFTSERMRIVTALRLELRTRDYAPVVFDFEPAASRDLGETVSTLAHMSRFVIVDITDARSVPHELQMIIPELAVPVVPLILAGESVYALFESFRKYSWVLKPVSYGSVQELKSILDAQVIRPAEIAVTAIRNHRLSKPQSDA